MTSENSISTKENEKEYYLGMFDLLKGYAVIAIILNHTHPLFLDSITSESIKSIVYYVYNQIFLSYTCCMPLLFMISGFGFRKMKVSSCIKKQFKTLMVPYILAGAAEILLFLAVQVCMKKGFEKIIFEELSAHVTGLIFGLDNGNNPKPFGLNYVCAGPIWYFMALYISWNILNIFFAYVKEQYIPVCVAFSVILGYVLGNLYHPYYFSAQGLVGVGFLYAGYLIREKQLLLKKLNPIIWALLILGTVLNYGFANFVFADFKFRVQTGLLELIFSGCAGYILMYVAFCIDSADNFVSNKLRVIGIYSLWIICCHNVEVKSIPLDSIVRKVFHGRYNLLSFIIMLIIRFVIVFCMFKVLSYIDKKIKKAQKAKKRAKRRAQNG